MKLNITFSYVQDELVRAVMTILYCVTWSTPLMTTERVLRLSPSTVPLDHSTRYFRGQAELAEGRDQVTVTSGGVSMVRLGAVGAPGQAGGRWGRGHMYTGEPHPSPFMHTHIIPYVRHMLAVTHKMRQKCEIKCYVCNNYVVG